MLKKDKKNKKSWIMWICGIILVVALIVIIVVFVICSNKKLDDSFFVSDDTKYVLALDSGDGMLSVDTKEYAPEKAYLVYFYSGDKVTDLKIYYKYNDEKMARNALNYFNNERTEEDQITKIEANGDYVVITTEEVLYGDMTAEDAKQQIEIMKTLKEMDINSAEDNSEVIDDAVDVTEEIEE